MIKFESISIEGFCSYRDPFFYKFSRPGINLILGHNGSGKSTIFHALSWCLYGKTLTQKDITPWEDLGYNKGTKVEVWFSHNKHEFRVVRCKGYEGKVEGAKGKNRLLVFLGDTLQEQLRDKRDVQKFIIERLGINFDLFKNSILFGQNITRLLKESGSTQKNIFDEAFRLNFISEARDRAKTELDILNRDKNLVDNDIIKLQYRIEAQEDILQEANKNNKARLLQIKKEAKNEALKVLDLEKQISKFDDLEKSRLLQKSLVAQYKLNMIKKGNCPTCGQPWPNKVKNKVVDDGLVETGERMREKVYNRALNEVSSLFPSFELDNTLDSMEELLEMLVNKLSRRNKLEALLEVHKDKIEELKSQYKKLKNQKKPKVLEIEGKIKSLTRKIKPLKRYLFKVKKNIRAHEWLLRDPLGNKGLKTYIFNSMLDKINLSIQRYAETLGYSIVFEMNLDSGRKDLLTHVFQKDINRAYHDLSGGQQQLVDVCLALALHDVISNKVNVLLMDEVFESLDEDNIEKVVNLIEVKSQQVSVHLMTHNTNFLPSNAKVTKIALSSAGFTSLAA